MNNWIRIENRNTWLDKIYTYHPDSTLYINQWRNFKKQTIEGTWRVDFGKYRYMPGPLYFYINFCRILDVNEETKSRRSIKPLLRDLEWEMAYLILEARGFSGWKGDNEFTSDLRVKEIEKDSEKLKKYRRLPKDCYKEDGTLKKFIEPRENIRKLHEYPKGAPLYFNQAKNAMIFGCLDKDTGVRMYDGSIKKAIDIKVGDSLMGIDSKPRIVKELVRGEAPIFEITQRYGESYKVTDTHILHLNKRSSKRTNNGIKIIQKPIDISVSEFLELPKNKQQQLYQGVQSEAIEYTKKHLIWDPYLLGLWLGDGFKREKMICGSYDDVEILNWLKNHKEENKYWESYHITNYKGQLGNKELWRFSWSDSRLKSKNNWFSSTLQNNKHIPNEYLLSTINDRLKLLAGMIDSDGSVEKNGRRATITNIDLNLLKQFQEVARSCGFRAVINNPHITGITNSLKYNLRITGELSKIPTKLLRKKLKDSYFGKGSNKNDISIKPIGWDNFYGFEVDKDHLFLLEDYTITHNSRGGGKSYYVGLANVLHEVIFDGAKYYDEESINKPHEVHCNIGSWESNKSSELCEKIELCMNNFATDSELGVWGDESSDDYEPIPFYKSMSGTLAPNNKWIHTYEKKVNGKWLKFGSKSKIVHTVYKDNPTAAAGGRYSIMVVEESGLHPSLTLTHNSNIGCTQRDALKFGTMIYIGTSGDIEKVRESRKMFMDPDSYDIVSYDDVYENSGKIGFFIPAYYTAQEFKDENGNTDVESALAYYLERRKKARDSKDANNYEGELMNYPIKPSEMFLTKKGNILPIGELEQQRANVISDKNRKLYYTVGELSFDSKQPRGVRFYPDLECKSKPIFDYPTPKNQDTEGALIVYEPPIEELIDGKIQVPNIYIIGYDPVDADTQGQGLSLSCLHVLKIPKDIKKYGGNELVATFIGRPFMGRDAVNEICEKLAMWYGNHDRMISFERGGNVKEFFEKKKKLNLLMTQPKTVMSYKSGETSRILLYGTPLKSFEQKFEAISLLRDWLLEEYATTEDGRLIRNLNLIRDTRLIEEMIAFDFDNNFDSVLAFAECIIGLKEKYNQFKDDAVKTSQREDILTFLNRNMLRTQNTLNY